MKAGFTAFASFGGHTETPQVFVDQVEVFSYTERLVRTSTGGIRQLESFEHLYATEAEALVAGAEELAARAAELQAAADSARARAAELAARGRVKVCSI